MFELELTLAEVKISLVSYDQLQNMIQVAHQQDPEGCKEDEDVQTSIHMDYLLYSFMSELREVKERYSDEGPNYDEKKDDDQVIVKLPIREYEFDLFYSLTYGSRSRFLVNREAYVKYAGVNGMDVKDMDFCCEHILDTLNAMCYKYEKKTQELYS